MKRRREVVLTFVCCRSVGYRFAVLCSSSLYLSLFLRWECVIIPYFMPVLMVLSVFNIQVCYAVSRCTRLLFGTTDCSCSTL
ncbi:hypothetical protein V1522DRAFT_399338, partial [Lipomyces starkeyi]